MMVDFGDHTYFKKKNLQVNIKSSQSVHMDFMIYLHNLSDKELEKQKRPTCATWLLYRITVKLGSVLKNLFFWAWLK